jgi:hypothetical protein
MFIEETNFVSNEMYRYDELFASANDLKQASWERWEVTFEKKEGTTSPAQNIFQRFVETGSKVLPLKTNIGGSVSAEKKFNGTSQGEVEVHVNKTDDSGNKVALKGVAELKTDQNGKTSGGGKLTVSMEREF